MEDQVIRVGASIDIDESAYNRIIEQIPGDEPGVLKFQGWVNGLVSDFSGGGLMLTPDDMNRIHDSNPDAGPDEIIQAVGESTGMAEGQMVVKWSVDPTYWEPLRAIADTQGLTVEQVIQNLMDNAVINGWFYDINPMPKQVVVTAEDHEAIAALIGNANFTGTDIAEYLKKVSEEPDMADLMAPSESVVG